MATKENPPILTQDSTLQELLLRELKKEKARAIFTKTLNAPFAIVSCQQRTSWQDHVKDFPRRGSGTCSPKHYYLGAQLEALEIPVIYVSTPFLWQELPVNYPHELQALVEKMPVQNHLSLLADLDGFWQTVDATWDRPLGQVGFSVPEENYELETSSLAVIPSGKQVFHYSAEEKFEWIKELRKSMPYSEIPDRFYLKLNNWFQEVRQQTV
jgi:hypothetical protein